MPRPYLHLCLVALASLGVGAAPSAAVDFTSSQITTPAADPTFPWFVDGSSETLHVEGDVAGGDGNADIVCFYGPTGRERLKANVTVTSGRFSDDVPLSRLFFSSPHPFCVLRAVPAGNVASHPPGTPSGFAGPRIGLGSLESVLGDEDYRIRQSQPRGALEWGPVGNGGLRSGSLFDPITFEESEYVLAFNGWLYSRNGCDVASMTCEQATGSEIIVDGNHAYSNASAGTLYGNASQRSGQLVPYPAMTYQYTRDPLTGDLQITEHDELVVCDPGGTAFFPNSEDLTWNDACSKFRYAGVQLDRTMIQDRAGRRGRITDVWTSTTGTEHQIELRYDQQFQGDQVQGTGPPTVRYPWLGAAYVTPILGETVPGPAAGGPATVFVDSNAYFADRFRQPQAAVRFSPPPADIHWYYATDTYFQATFRITGTVPATGSLVIEHAYFMEPTKELLLDALDPPTIAITAPADESTFDHADVTVTGTASDPGGTVASVTVNGTAASLEADGTWSAVLTLAQGANAITAVATDLAGNTATATLTITFVGKGPPGPPEPGGGEICDNCLDDDGNDLVDFEDPSCCTAEAMAVKRLAVIPGKRGTRLALKAGLAQAGLPAGTAWTQDVSLQLRAAGGEVLCARVPATSVVRTKKSARFRDPGHEVPSAAGVDKLLLRARKSGAGVLGASGRPVSLDVPATGEVHATLGLRDPGSAEQGNRCAGATVVVKARKKGGVTFP